MIRLTTSVGEVFLAIRHISSLVANMSGGTTIVMGNGDAWLVEESTEEIGKMHIWTTL